jgi:hypothetical protein
MLGISLEEFLGPRYKSTLPYALGALSGEAQIFECEITLHDGPISRGIVRYYPDVVDGIVQGFTVYVADDEMVKHLQMQLEEANSRNHHLASHDYLTGLPNRVLLTDRIRTLLSEANSCGEMVGLVVMNVDGFRRINDTYGLDGGDAVIREVARRMKGAINPTETLIRTNGDEFLYERRSKNRPQSAA